MPAQIVRTGVPSGRSKKKKKRAAGDLGQDPGEMVTAGVQPALVRLRPDEYCRSRGGVGDSKNIPCRGFHGQKEGAESILKWSVWRSSPGTAGGPRGLGDSRRGVSGLTGIQILL